MKEKNINKKKWYQKLWAKIIGILGVIALIATILSDGGQVYDRFSPTHDENISTAKPSQEEEHFLNKKQDQHELGKTEITTNPVVNDSIKELIEEAREKRKISISEAHTKFMQAYELLPVENKNSKFIRKIENISSFETQVEHLDSFFSSLNF